MSWIVNDQQDGYFEGIFVPKTVPTSEPDFDVNRWLVCRSRHLGSTISHCLELDAAPVLRLGLRTQISKTKFGCSAASTAAVGPALNLERLRYFSYLASDIYVEEVDKFFSFPYAQRASVMQVTRREFPCVQGRTKGSRLPWLRPRRIPIVIIWVGSKQET